MCFEDYDYKMFNKLVMNKKEEDKEEDPDTLELKQGVVQRFMDSQPFVAPDVMLTGREDEAAWLEIDKDEVEKEMTPGGADEETDEEEEEEEDVEKVRLTAEEVERIQEE